MDISTLFHPDYKSIIERLPKSIVERAYYRLIEGKRHPIHPNEINKKHDYIETYLRHTLSVYERSLLRKRDNYRFKKFINKSIKDLQDYRNSLNTQSDNVMRGK